jgi:hypothetical protein
VYPEQPFLALQYAQLSDKAKARLLTSGKRPELRCAGIFTSMVVFAEHYWVGTAEENPDELPMAMPRCITLQPDEGFDALLSPQKRVSLSQQAAAAAAIHVSDEDNDIADIIISDVDNDDDDNEVISIGDASATPPTSAVRASSRVTRKRIDYAVDLLGSEDEDDEDDDDSLSESSGVEMSQR